jgi:hypothetical protein
MSGRKTKEDHVLLTEPSPTTVLLYTLTQSFKKLGVVRHAAVFTVARAETPRSD